MSSPRLILPVVKIIVNKLATIQTISGGFGI